MFEWDVLEDLAKVGVGGIGGGDFSLDLGVMFVTIRTFYLSFSLVTHIYSL